MKRILFVILVVVFLLSACSDGVISREVIEKQYDSLGYRLVVRECRVEGTRLEPCETITYPVTKDAYDANEVGKEYKKP